MAGIAFYIGDEQLTLSTSQKISITLESPMLSDKTIPGAVSFPFNIAATAHNKRLLNISNTLMSFGEYQNVKCQCHLGGNLFRSGYFIINTHTEKTINITFTEFNSEEDFDPFFLKDMNLPTIQKGVPGDWGADQIKDAIHERATGIFPDGEKDFICPTVFNRKVRDVTSMYIDETSTTRQKEIVELTTILFQNLYENSSYEIYTGLWEEEIYNINLISPFFFVNYILKNLFKKLGYSVNINKLSEDDLQDLIVYNNKGFRLKTHDQYITNPPFTVHPPGAFTTEIRYLKYADFMPEINFTDFLTAIKSTFNIIYDFDYSNSTVSILNKSDIIEKCKTIDITAICEPVDTVDLKKDTLKVPYCYVYAKKDDEILEEFFKLDKYNYKGFVASTADLPTTGNAHFDYYMIMQQVPNNDYYPIYYYATNNTWQLLSAGSYTMIRPYDVFLEKEVKDKQKYELKTDTAVTRLNKRQYIIDGDTSDITGKFYFCPAVDTNVFAEMHNIYLYGVNTVLPNISSIHLLFYRGLALNSVSEYFPFASRNRFFPTGGIFGTDYSDAGTKHSLEIDGEDGLFEKFHKKWYLFLKSLHRKITVNVLWNAASINNNIFLNKLQINGNRFIASKITITADVNTIYPCKTEMYQIEPK